MRARGVESTPIPTHLMVSSFSVRKAHTENKACFYKAESHMALNAKLFVSRGKGKRPGGPRTRKPVDIPEESAGWLADREVIRSAEQKWGLWQAV